jgi:hypothetical protein
MGSTIPCEWVRLRTADGERLEFSLPAGSDVVHLGGGWVEWGAVAGGRRPEAVLPDERLHGGGLGGAPGGADADDGVARGAGVMSDGGEGGPVRVELRGEPSTTARISIAEAIRRGWVVPMWTAEEQARWGIAGRGRPADGTHER